MTQVAFITGASRGIGRAIALRAAELGYNLFLLARNAAALAEVVEQCKGRDVAVECLVGELADEKYMDKALQSALGSFGAIEVLINNAGASSRQAVQDADLNAWRDVLDVNFNAVMYLSRQVLPSMIERKSGAVVNISSISGRNTHAEGAIYCASKHALNGFSGCMYEDVREHGIKVSTIMPGFVDTGMTSTLDLNSNHMIQPNDVADAVQYVLSASSTCCPTEIILRPQARP
jgi:NADP-dependent 3-hydroxy acid dehydrogenase YdfG